MSGNLKFTVITVCYNSGKTIHDAIQSVIIQDYNNIEYLIIDGGSTDNTAEIVKAFNHPSIIFSSEIDQGLYDAMNKGVAKASGDIIAFLHSDDFYAHSGVISEIAGMFKKRPEKEAISSSIEIYKNENFSKPFRVYKATRFKPWQFRIGMQPPHPGLFVRKEAFKKTGDFNIKYRISADFDWILRLIRLNKADIFYTDFVSVHMRDGGASSSGMQSKLLMNRENLQILRCHNIFSNSLLIYLKYFLKIFQLKI